MGMIEDLAERYRTHIEIPWQRTVAGAQRVIMVVYDKEQERTLRARLQAFRNATEQTKHTWHEVDVTDAFATWMSQDDYRDAYFETPDDLQIKLEAEFAEYVASIVRAKLTAKDVNDSSVVAIIGVGSLFGLTRLSRVIRLVEADIRGRLLVFFPGHLDNNNYRLLDARDGWNYLAVPIALNG